MSNFVRTYGGNLAANASGLKSLQRALGAGLTINQIRDQTNREGVSFGYRARDYLNARPSHLFISRFGGNEDTMSHSGLAAVQRAEAAGLSVDQIQNMARNQGVTFGYRAQNYFQTKAEEKAFADRMAQMESAMAQQRQQYEADLQGMKNTLNAAAAPNQAEPVLGVKGAGGMKGKKGIRGAFGRAGDRIKGLKISNINI